MFDYASLVGDVDGLIEEFGAPAVLRRAAPGDYDTNFGEVDDNGDLVFNTKAVRVAYKANQIDGTQILATDVRLLMSPSLKTAPQPNDRITFAGDEYIVVTSTPTNPAGTTVLHEVQARA